MPVSKNFNRTPWVDILRIAACFLVVLSHSCDFFVARFDENAAEFLSGSAWGSLVRSCVPLFVMISGVLLLPVKEPSGVFYKKRLSKVVWPLVVWSLLTPLFYLAYGYPEGVNPEGMADGQATAYYMMSFPLNFNYATTPLWYLYMLVGLYLFIPIISPWIAQASRKELKTFLYIWGFTLFIPFLQLFAPYFGYQGNYGHLGLFGLCDWNPVGTFYYFTGFLGYLVLGHYMTKYPSELSWGKTVSRATLLFIAGYCITFIGFVQLQKHFPGDYAYLEIIWYFTGINVFMMTYAVFMVLQKIKVERETTVKRLSRAASLTFGIYLCHFFLVFVCYEFVYAYIPLPPYLQIPVIAVGAFIISAIAVRLLQKLPGHRYIIG